MAATLLVSGCVADPGPTTFAEATPTEPPTIEAKLEPVALPAFRQTLKPLDTEKTENEEPSGLPAIKAAHENAVIEAAPDGFINATQYYPYQRGALYELHAAPGFISVIELQPGETLLNYALGDTARWIVGDVIRDDQPQLLVKPTRSNLSTNLVITTDKRVYVIEATSHDNNTYNATIAWTYPFEELSQQVAVIDAENDRRADTIIAGVPIERLNFDYEISGDEPSWRPVRAFDDGVKSYLEFPKSVGSFESPPLFLKDEKGSGQLVNYRVKQNYYIIDRLFDQAELRLNDVVVRIDKTQGSTWSRWFSTPAETTRKSLRRDPDDHGEHHDRDGHRM